MNDNRTVLVLGASGGIGGEVARQLARAGWQVRGMKRALAAATVDADGIAWTAGDAMERADVARAAQGCAVIVHAVNPPGYRDWDRLVLPMLDNTIAAAEANGVDIGDSWLVVGSGHTRAVVDQRDAYEPRVVRFFSDTLGAP